MHPECQEIKPFTHLKHLKRHQKIKHQMHGGSKQYFCALPTCRAFRRPFNRKENFTAHLDLHAKTNTPKLTRRACDGCRGSKVKCSGRSPCERCVRKNIPCTIVMNIDPFLGNKITTLKTSSPTLQSFLHEQSLPTQHTELDEDHQCKRSRSQSQNNLENEVCWDPKKKNKLGRAYNK